MPRRKKYARLPSGFGNISFLGRGRRNPYAVYPPCKAEDTYENGHYRRQKALCYVDSYHVAFAVLTAWHQGLYVPGMENEISAEFRSAIAYGGGTIPDAIRGVLSSIKAQQAKGGGFIRKPTFKDIYDRWYQWKFDDPNSKAFSENTRKNYEFAVKHCESLFDRPFDELKADDLQRVVDENPSPSTVKFQTSLLNQLYVFAIMEEITDKNLSKYIRIKAAHQSKEKVPFSEGELMTLWENKADPDAEMILIMVYSGFRVREYETLVVDLKQDFFQGGSKTEAGKDRVVPIHPAIRPLVVARLARYGKLAKFQYKATENCFKRALVKYGLQSHTMHDTRHTFSALCDRYGVNENDKKRMLGHVLHDLTAKVYGHRTVEDLKKEIVKIPSSFAIGE